MKILAPVLATVAASAAMLAVSAWAWPHTPDLAPVHWGLNGQPDRFGSRAEALLMIPAITAVLGVGRAVMPRLMPRKARLERSAVAYNATWIAATCLLFVIHCAVSLRGAGVPVNMVRLTVGACGVLALVTGNFMGKVRYNYVMGLRTPWTLSSERVWDKAHRLLGPLVMAAGLAGVALAAIAPPPPVLLGGFMAAMLAPAVIATAYAFSLSRRQEKGELGGA